MALTNEDVWKAADELDAAGTAPTLAKVREKLGGGSYTTISSAMGEWKARRRAAGEAAQEPLPPDLQESLHQMAASLWAQARNGAQASLAGQRQQLEAEHDALREQTAEAVELADRISGECDELRAQLADAARVRTERDQLERDLQALKQHTAAEVHKAAEKAARKDSEAIEARKSERAAIERAAKAEGKVEALEKAMADLRSALAPSRQRRQD